ncbi:MAG TPA: universal stress protein [Planctomycetaceae bacterium]|nr:universal stress protein [Planctomycetaceae bacterium]
MIALKKILFPTDFSDGAKAAQEYAVALAEQFKSELHVLHVLADMVMMMPEPGSALALPPNYLVDLKTQAEQSLAGVLSGAGQTGLSVVRALRMGSPFVEIVRYAKEADIDLVVLGTHGRGALMHILLGSVAERVVRKAQCPVLTVHRAGHQFVMP